ncbi:MAG: DUF2149 domain-containing protein [Thermoleophilia bacterium]|jgi:hypothetical protein|nr:DUF2149 domain-containing protein [Thermoleophilia bacterium]
MSDESTDSEVQFLPTVLGRSRGGYRYMKRRRLDRLDRNGDPLDGVVNLFDVAIVLAVGFLVAALAGLGISGILTSDDMTIVTDPGTEQMQVIVRQGDEITRLDLESGAEVSGVGTLIGQFFRLADGTTVYVPAGTTAPGATTGDTVTPVPETTASPAVVPAPEAPVMPAPDEDAVTEGQPPPEPPAKKSATEVSP